MRNGGHHTRVDRAAGPGAVRALATAARRRETLPGHVREAVSTAMTVVMWPFGLVDRGVADLRDHLATSPASLASTPVLLVHGYGANKSNWLLLGRHLRDAGYGRIDALNYNPLTADVPTLAERCVERARRVMDACGTDRIHLIGHSLGGVVARHAVQLDGLEEAATCITVASPHGGAPAARLGLGRTAAQLRPGSSLLRRLAESSRPLSTRFVAYYSNLDLIVPGHRAMITEPALGATNVLVKDEGHLSILWSRRLATSVAEHLRRADEPVGRAA